MSEWDQVRRWQTWLVVAAVLALFACGGALSVLAVLP